MACDKEIYLDNNATTRVLPSAAEEAFAVMEDLYGNPSSSHIAGLQARRILESGRDVARQALGATTGRIVFTSGATEAIQTGIFSALYAAKQRLAIDSPHVDRGLLLYGVTEHKAVPQALHHWNALLDLNCEVVAIPVNGQGQADLEFLRQHIDRTHLVCTMAVNNETGVINDLYAIQRIVRSVGSQATWLVDCVQAVGKLQLDLSSLAIDYAPISGHKLYAPKGIGVLYVRQGAPFTPLLAGGGQEGGARGGTENLPGVAAIAHVLRELLDPDTTVFSSHAKLVEFRDRIASSLRSSFPGLVFNTPFEHAVPTTLNFAVEGVTSKELLDLFDAAGIRVSSGSACGSAVRGSYVLEAMGLPQWRSDGAIRLSFGPATTIAEIEAACTRIEEAGRALAESCVFTARPNSVNAKQQLDGLLQLKSGSDCSWILCDGTTKRCVIVDPFADLLGRIESVVRCQDLSVVAVLDTHNHVDHKSPRVELVELLQDKLIDSSASTDLLGWPDEAAESVILGDDSEAPAIRLSEELILAKTSLPGHTVDGLAFLAGQPNTGRLEKQAVKFAFTGDTLLIGGIGRTDFATSTAEQMLSSLRKLPLIVADNTVICPTHDYNVGFVTTLGSERQHNGLLARILDPVVKLTVDEYLATKKKLDAKIEDDKNSELVCGLIQDYTEGGASSIDVKPEDLSDFFRDHCDSLVIDVRERHEFHFTQDWKSIGLTVPPKNIPLTRLGDFLSQILAHGQHNREIVFICRSGNRSSKAAQVVRRLGLPAAWHIAGGIALGASPSTEVLEAEEMEYAI